MDFTKSNLSGSNFSEAELHYANFENACLVSATFEGATLNGGRFINTNLTGANLKNAGLTYASIKKVDFTGANFTGVKGLTEFDFLHAELVKHAILPSICIQNANFKNKDLTGVDFRLIRNLTWVNLVKASSLKGVKLPTYLQMSNMHLNYQNFAAAVLSRINFNRTHLVKTIFRNADLSYASFGRNNFKQADLTGVKLTDANLTQAENLIVNQLLSYRSIIDIAIHKGMFSNNELKEIKEKMVQEYKKNFDEIQDVTELLKKLEEIVENDRHTLKIIRNSCFREYGNTDTYAAVINYGRKRLLELAS